MKLIYQNMLSFLIVILTTLGIILYSVTSTSTTSEYNRTYKDLESYAGNLEKIALKTDSKTGQIHNITGDNIKTVEQVLSDKNVQFAIFDYQNDQVYPTPPTNVKLHLKQSYWNKLKQGKTIRNIQKPESSEGNPRLSNKKDNLSYVYVLTPWFQNGKLIAAVWAGSDVSQLQTNIGELNKRLYFALLISLLAAIILSFLLSRYQVNRINRLRGATRRVANNDFSVHIESKNTDELDDLANDFNTMVKSLEASDKEIKRQEQRRKEFMADASHEMRTPLTTINGLLEGLAYDAIPEESKGQSIQLMRNETNRLIRLVNENLDYEKIRTNQITLAKRVFDANTPLKDIVSQLQKKAAESKDKLTLETPEDELETYADYDRFVQVMFNIMQNSIQFTDNGEITVTGYRADDRHASIFKIQDTGIGMSEEQVKNIWDRYYKADPSRKNRKYGESGLGLSIVHQLIENHGGEIHVKSKLHEGTTFTVTLFDEGYEHKVDTDKAPD
ncbi:sensor histidine kinase [Companilactobacillus nodensis]|uniref:histidine kinase n=1 Tax=Companilactobacillus nodensis DSM 19682 = JCM 14932 = NBRC 107160 TaxID=1423775 RepID=A0A0R1KI34_9LACO|nr:HAMP domain-containing sensor histidine kinase [Companilactobacillus nodensis]KRK78695.1 histidine protein kinase [Companilactobacillus nodensis DSM 19682 = JCM 14932 = NBRC 107160]